MKDVSTDIKYKGETYRLVFNLNVMEEIQAEFGSIEKWGAACEPGKGEPDIRALKFGFAAMLNEGLDIMNEENATERPKLTLKKVGRMISEIGMEKTAAALNATVVKSTQSTEKNV